MLAVVLALAVTQSRSSAQSPAASAAAASGRFRTAAELVLLPVTVVDAAGRVIAGLQADDFAVYEDGRQQPVSLFATGAAPLDLVLLLDASGSMTPRLAAARRAATTILRGLRPEDRASVIRFDDRIRVLQPFTADRSAVEAAIRDSEPGGGTAFYEALYVVLRDLAKQRQAAEGFRRQAVIVVSDGVDNASLHISYDEALEEAQRSLVLVFTIVPGSSAPAFGGPLGERMATAIARLRRFADVSGARAFIDVDDATRAYRAIAEELTTQYWLAYPPPAHASGGFKSVAVRVPARPDLRARTRLGYEASR